MNFYDKIHELVRSLKQTNEYKEYLSIKETIKKDEKLYNMIKDFKEKQKEFQLKHISGVEMSNAEKSTMENLYSIIIQNENARKLLENEMKIE